MKTAYFDCFGGASGDMIVGALLDAGVKLSDLRSQLARLELAEFSLRAEPVTRAGLAGTKFDVDVNAPPAGHTHGRHLADIFKLIDRAGYCQRVDDRIRKVFRRLGEAEAKVHGTTIDKIHFHEVGAVDSIVDIVGAVLALELLDVERVLCSPIPLGSGTVTCQHGVLPVPPPAVAELMRNGVIAASDGEGELCTPTGAALMTTLAESFTTLPAMAIDGIGYGAGGREDTGRINLLRVFVGSQDTDGEADTVVELAANVDTMTGELLGAVLEMALAAGALDAWATPITMKKSRPAVKLGVLCHPADVGRMEELLLTETTTIGVRRHECSRTKLSRRHVTVETPYGAIRIKVCGRDGREYSAAPEFDDCREAAQTHHAPIRTVQAAAVEAYRAKP